MVTYLDLRNAQPNLWQVAADDLLDVAKQSERTAENIHANGTRELEDNWADDTGALAKQTLQTVANRMVNSGILARGATTALDTLQDSIDIAQRQLDAAVIDATRLGFVVGDDGRVDIGPDFGDFLPADVITMINLQIFIDDAVEAATQADEACALGIDKVTEDPDVISTDDARAAQSDAVHQGLLAMRMQLPDGLSSTQVEEWWNNLTPQQQEDMKLACPTELAALDGIPQSVKDSLGDTGQGYSPLDTVRWALDNYDNTDIDVFGNNCANFASHALMNGGLDEKGTFTWEDDGWGRSLAGDWGLPWVEGMSHTESWYNSNAQRDVFLNNGGSDLPVDQARPGDIVYFEYDDGPDGHSDGVAHHTAVVTAVLPDGEVLYTQHTPGAANQSLQGRLPMGEQSEGQQHIRIVRPKQTW